MMKIDFPRQRARLARPLCPDTKTCAGCKKVKLRSEFHKDVSRKDGLCRICKDCRCGYERAYREAHPEKIAARMKRCRRSHKKEIAVSDKRYRRANREKIAKQQKEYRQTPAGKGASQKRAARQREKFPEKVEAVHAVGNAVRGGQLIRPSICSSCFNEAFVEGHHADYSKPLEVEWLCKKCHVRVHHGVECPT